MEIIFMDRYGYRVERFIDRPFKSFFRVLCQIVRRNISEIKIIL